MANPRVGSTRSDGKVYAGQNYGYQSPKSFKQLAKEGKFRVGTQALDRLTSSAGNALNRLAPGVVRHFQNVKADQERLAARQDRQIRNTAGNRVANAAQNNATGKTLDAVSKATNVDRRIVGAGAAAAQLAISSRALKGGAAKPQPQARSVGAAARSDVAGKAGGRTIYRPAVDGAVSKSGQPVRGRVSNYRVNQGLRTQNNTAVGRKVAAQTSPTAQRSNARAAAKAKDTAQTGRTHRVINTAKGSGGKPSASALRKAQAERDRGVTHIQLGKNKPNSTESAHQRIRPGIAANKAPGSDPKPARASGDRARTASSVQSRAVNKATNDRGTISQRRNVEAANLPRDAKATAAQARGDIRSASRNGVGQRVPGSTPKPQSTTGNGRVTGRVRTNARVSGREAADNFKAKAKPIVDEKTARVKDSQGSVIGRKYGRKLTAKMNAGARRVKAAAEGKTTSTQTNDKLSRSRSTAYQDPKKNDPRTGYSEAQARRLSDNMNARKTAGKLPPITQTNRQTHLPASTTAKTAKVTPPNPAKAASRRGGNLSAKGRIKTPKAGSTVQPTRNGKKLTELGKPKSSTGVSAQRRASAFGPDAKRQAASDSKLRQRNRKSNRTGRS